MYFSLTFYYNIADSAVHINKIHLQQICTPNVLNLTRQVAHPAGTGRGGGAGNQIIHAKAAGRPEGGGGKRREEEEEGDYKVTFFNSLSTAERGKEE